MTWRLGQQETDEALFLQRDGLYHCIYYWNFLFAKVYFRLVGRNGSLEQTSFFATIKLGWRSGNLMKVWLLGKLVVSALDKTRERAKAIITTLAFSPVPSECCSGPHTILRVPGAENNLATILALKEVLVFILRWDLSFWGCLELTCNLHCALNSFIFRIPAALILPAFWRRHIHNSFRVRSTTICKELN